MIRIVLLILALMAVPFIIYGLYEILRQGPDGAGMRKPSQWERKSVIRLGFIGLALAAAGVVAVLAMSEGTKGGVYVPARVENGKLIPGEFIDPQTSEESPQGQGSEQ